MKILWTKEQYEEVIKLGDEFRAELPEMSNEVSFNLWRQDSLDSLFVKDRAKYEEIMNSYRMPDWNGVERIN
jgi:formiminotetrahydrofolate cyclodeaminase